MPITYRTVAMTTATTSRCAAGLVVPGDVVLAPCTLTDNGPSDAQNVTVGERTLPAGLAIAAAPAPGGGGFTPATTGLWRAGPYDINGGLEKTSSSAAVATTVCAV